MENKITEIPLIEPLTEAKTFASLPFEIEKDKLFITIKIKRLGSNQLLDHKWSSGIYWVAAYTIEPIELTFLDKIVKNNGEETILPPEGKKVIIERLLIVYKDLYNYIPVDYIFFEGAKVKLKLKKRSNINTWLDVYWFLQEISDCRFSLQIRSYEISNLSFLRGSGRACEIKMMEKIFSREEQKIEEWYQKVINNLPLISLNFQGQLVNSANPKSYQVEIEGELIALDQLIGDKYWKVRKALVQEIKQNINDWKIEGETVKCVSNGREHPIVGLKKILGKGNWKFEIYQEWEKIKIQLHSGEFFARAFLGHLDKNELSRVDTLDLSYRYLAGKVDLSDFPSLKKLDLSHNYITELDVSNCPQLSWICLKSNPNLTCLCIKNLNWIKNLEVDNILTLKIAEKRYQSGKLEVEPKSNFWTELGRGIITAGILIIIWITCKCSTNSIKRKKWYD